MVDPTAAVSAVTKERLAQLGDAGTAWLAGLGDLVADLEGEWGIHVGEPLLHGSGGGYVARARDGADRPVVLKVAVPGPDTSAQVATLRLAAGSGYVRLLAEDVERGAMLLEGLGASMAELRLPAERALDLLCQTLRAAWTVPTDDLLPFDQELEKARSLSQLVARLWVDLGRPCSRDVHDLALRYADRRAAAFDLDRCVRVHGDPHPGNALEVLDRRPGAESGFVLVDPDGFLADRAYDLGVVLRDWSAQLMSGDAAATARRFCRLLSEGSGVEPQPIWEWGFLERVSTGLFILQYGAEDLARPFLDSAELLV